jgi:hypothetical protein
MQKRSPHPDTSSIPGRSGAQLWKLHLRSLRNAHVINPGDLCGEGDGEKRIVLPQQLLFSRLLEVVYTWEVPFFVAPAHQNPLLLESFKV